MKEFILFIQEKGVLGLAVGIIVGGSVTKLVSSLVDNIISPVIGALTGKIGALGTFAYTVPYTTIIIKWGAFVSSLIDFIIILFVVYFLFIKSPLNRIDRKRE